MTNLFKNGLSIKPDFKTKQNNPTLDFQAFSFYLNILEGSYDIHRQSNGRNPAMHCEISLYGEGFSIMWPLTHISAEWDPERGMITANGVWLSINPWTDISQGCWGHMSNAINPSIHTQMAQCEEQTYNTFLGY